MSSGFQLARRQAEAYETFTSVFMDGSARLLVDSAGIDSSDVVLDLACGTGLVARHVAPLVADGGRVVGADINAAMIEVAIASTGDAVEWVEAASDALPFAEDTFTHVICQQSFQFFPKPFDAMAEARRVLRPDGILLATVWATPGHNPYIETQLEMLATLDSSVAQSVKRATPPNADDFLRSIAESAGFTGVDIALLEHTVRVTDLPIWFLAQTASTPWGPTLASLTDAQRRGLASEIASRMDQYAIGDGAHQIPFCSYRLEAKATG